jgi:hypothetical protein
MKKYLLILLSRCKLAGQHSIILFDYNRTFDLDYCPGIALPYHFTDNNLQIFCTSTFQESGNLSILDVFYYQYPNNPSTGMPWRIVG